MNFDSDPIIRVKLLGKSKPGGDELGWHRRFPNSANGNTRWGNCQFILDRHCMDYDWLVVYDDMPSLKGERHTLWEETLICSRQNTMLITTEPSTIKVYGSRFLNQFGWILTSQEPSVIQHPGAIFSQPGLVWFYADSDPRGAYDNIRDNIPIEKTKDISAVCSVKQQKHTLHHKRYEFIMALKKYVPEMELFGRGIRYVEDKADALDPYKYHVAIENFYGAHHWTEKLADPFLGGCMPVYYGCPNAEDYFPAESFLRIDIDDVDLAAETIQRAIKDKLYEKNLPAILESRRRVVEQYAPAANISRLVNLLNKPDAPRPFADESILSRHALRRKSLANALSYASEKAWVSLRHQIQPQQKR